MKKHVKRILAGIGGTTAGIAALAAAAALGHHVGGARADGVFDDAFDKGYLQGRSDVFNNRGPTGQSFESLYVPVS